MEYIEKIGEALIRHDAIKPHQVENILLRQECGDRRRFGEIAVDLRYLQRSTLDSYLQTGDLPLWQKSGSFVQSGDASVRRSKRQDTYRVTSLGDPSREAQREERQIND
jgi:hypothetical protein